MRTRARKWIGVAAVVTALVVAALIPVPGEHVRARGAATEGPAMDLSAYSAAPPERPLRFLFIHHSTGGQLLADPGEPSGEDSVHSTHPNGGGLRRLLAEAGYAVHEASYGSSVGEHTDLGGWLPKFRDEMDRVRRVRMQDELLPDGERNDIVAFKSCFPNSDFVAWGETPGDPAVPTLTVENARSEMRALLPHFQARPDTLFVYLTAPPRAPRLQPEPAWKWIVKRALGRGTTPDRLREQAARARRFNDWMKSPDGWLAGYDGNNVVVFDYFDVLTGGDGDLLAYPTGGGVDSHPSSEGQRRAAEAFVPFLNRAVRRAGLL